MVTLPDKDNYQFEWNALTVWYRTLNEWIFYFWKGNIWIRLKQKHSIILTGNVFDVPATYKFRLEKIYKNLMTLFKSIILIQIEGQQALKWTCISKFFCVGKCGFWVLNAIISYHNKFHNGAVFIFAILWYTPMLIHILLLHYRSSFENHSLFLNCRCRPYIDPSIIEKFYERWAMGNFLLEKGKTQRFPHARNFSYFIHCNWKHISTLEVIEAHFWV